MDAPFQVNFPRGIKLTVELKGRPVDFEIFVPGAGTIKFQRAVGPSGVGRIDHSGIPAANHTTHLRPDGKIDKHEVFAANGDSLTYSDPEM